MRDGSVVRRQSTRPVTWAQECARVQRWRLDARETQPAPFAEHRGRHLLTPRLWRVLLDELHVSDDVPGAGRPPVPPSLDPSRYPHACWPSRSLERHSWTPADLARLTRRLGVSISGLSDGFTPNTPRPRTSPRVVPARRRSQGRVPSEGDPDMSQYSPRSDPSRRGSPRAGARLPVSPRSATEQGASSMCRSLNLAMPRIAASAVAPLLAGERRRELRRRVPVDAPPAARLAPARSRLTLQRAGVHP